MKKLMITLLIMVELFFAHVIQASQQPVSPSGFTGIEDLRGQQAAPAANAFSFDALEEELVRTRAAAIRPRSESVEQAAAPAPQMTRRRIEEPGRQVQAAAIPVAAAGQAAPAATREVLVARYQELRQIILDIQPCITENIQLAVTGKLNDLSTCLSRNAERFAQVSAAIKAIEDRYRLPEYSQADLTRAKEKDKNLVFARLRGADLTGVDLSGTNLFGADLRDTLLDRTILDDANLCFAKLDGARIINCNINKVVFFNISARGATIQNSEITDALIINLVAQGQMIAPKQKLILYGLTVQNVKITHSTLFQINGSFTDWQRVSIENSILAFLTLSNSNFTNIKFLSDVLAEVNLENSESTAVTYNKCRLANFSYARSQLLKDIYFDESALRSVNLSGVTLIEELKIFNPEETTLQEIDAEDVAPGDKHKKIFLMGSINCAYSTLFKCHFLGKGEQPKQDEYLSFADYCSTQFPVRMPALKAANYFMQDGDISYLTERMPVTLLIANFKQAVLHSCYFKNLLVTRPSQVPENLEISRIHEGGIFDNVHITHNGNSYLRARGAMVNGNIDPEFSSYYENPKIHENFATVVSKDVILTVARVAGTEAAKFACNIQ